MSTMFFYEDIHENDLSKRFCCSMTLPLGRACKMLAEFDVQDIPNPIIRNRILAAFRIIYQGANPSQKKEGPKINVPYSLGS